MVKHTQTNRRKLPTICLSVFDHFSGLAFKGLILTLNNFVFSGIHYLQKIGCAMGTICAPNYANIFMGKFEKTYIYPYINQFSNFYCRFMMIYSLFGMDRNTTSRIH